MGPQNAKRLIASTTRNVCGVSSVLYTVLAAITKYTTLRTGSSSVGGTAREDGTKKKRSAGCAMGGTKL